MLTRMRRSAEARPVEPCLACGRPVPRRTRAALPLCRVCVAKRAHTDWVTYFATPRVRRKPTKPASPSLLHTLGRPNKGAG